MAIEIQVLIKDKVPVYIGRYFNMVIFGQGPWRSTAQCFPAIGWSRIDNIFWQMLYLSLASRFPWPHSEPVPAPFDTTRVKSFFGLARYYQYITNYKMKLALQASSLKGFRLRTSSSENQIFCLGDPVLGKKWSQENRRRSRDGATSHGKQRIQEVTNCTANTQLVSFSPCSLQRCQTMSLARHLTP